MMIFDSCLSFLGHPVLTLLSLG